LRKEEFGWRSTNLSSGKDPQRQNQSQLLTPETAEVTGWVSKNFLFSLCYCDFKKVFSIPVIAFWSPRQLQKGSKSKNNYKISSAFQSAKNCFLLILLNVKNMLCGKVLRKFCKAL
jgi:hypothetical protein